jgi:hypothetical protein
MEPVTGESYVITHPSEGVLTATFLYEAPPKTGPTGVVRQWRFLVDGRETSIPETAVLGLVDD